MTKYIEHDYLPNPSGDSAYIIVKQKIGQGNLDRIGISLYLNGRLQNKTKGIELESADKPLPTVAAYGEIKRVTINDRSAYHIWEIPAKKLSSEPGAGLLFIRSVESKNRSIFGVAIADMVYGGHNSPFECMFMTIPDPDSVKKGDKPVKHIQLFDGNPVGDRNWFKFLQEYRVPEATFFGNYFIIDKPGVYYLGDVDINGELTPVSKEGLGDSADTAINIFAKVTNNPVRAKKYLKVSGLEKFPFYNASSSWKDIYMGDFRTYINTPLELQKIYNSTAVPE